MTDLQKDMPEAVASATYRLESPNGFTYLFTVRGKDEIALLNRMGELEDFLMAGGWKPEEGELNKQKEEGDLNKTEQKDVCPKCGGKLLYKETKKGKEFVECENRNYDFDTGEVTGCEYIKWDVSAPENKNKPTKKQKDLIKDIAPDKWSDDLTKSKASEIIGNLLDE